MRIFAFAGLVTLILAAAFGQIDDSTPRFEAADIHSSLHDPLTDIRRVFMSSGFYHGGRYEIHNASMIDLVRTAYGVDNDKVLGGPNWVEMDRFEVIAKAPADTTQETLRLMLKSLLADRFKLVVHSDKKELPTFALRAGKKPLLKEASGSGDTGCKPQPVASGGQGGGMLNINGVTTQLGPDLSIAYACHNMTMAAFADALHTMPISGVGGNPLVDETELKGSWDFDLKYSLGIGRNAAVNGRIGIFEAVDKQLGLKL